MKKLIRTTTIPSSMRGLLTGQLKFMSQYYDVIAITSGGENYDKLLEEQKVRGYVVPFTRKTFSFFSDVRAFIMLIRIFRKEKPFIVHSHTSKDGLLCMVAAWLCGVPNRLYTIAGLADLSGVRGFVLNIAERVTFRFATKLYPNSYNMMEVYLKNGMFKSEKAKVILNGSSNGIDTEYFSMSAVNKEHITKIKTKIKENENTFVFVYIGRLVSDKGVNELIKSFSLLSREKNNIKLLLVGNYEKDIDCLKPVTIDTLENNTNIIFKGYQSDIRPYLAISDALILPSYREGMPNVVMQAGAMEKAAIVTDINGCNEIIIDGVNGSIIPRKDSQALYRKMKCYYENRDKVRKMSDNARKLIEDRYNRIYFWNALIEEYRSLEK